MSEDSRYSVAILGLNKKQCDKLSNMLADELGLRYMDLDGYLKYCMGGLSLPQVRTKAGKDYVKKTMSDNYASAAEFEGAVISSSPILFCVGADAFIDTCWCFTPDGDKDIQPDLPMLSLAKEVDIKRNWKKARKACIHLSGDDREKIRIMVKFLEGKLDV